MHPLITHTQNPTDIKIYHFCTPISSLSDKLILAKRLIALLLSTNPRQDNVLTGLISTKTLKWSLTGNYRCQPAVKTNLGDWLVGSVQFSPSVMSNSLQPNGMQHARPPCPSPTPGVLPNSCPLSRCCHPTISSSGIPFSSYPQSFSASRSSEMVSSSYQVAKVLEFQLRHQSFQ